MSKKITESELREMIKQELASVNEAVDHQSISKIVKCSSSLLKAVEAFEASAPSNAVMTGLKQQIDKIKQTLENILSNPGSYVDKPGPKVVSYGASAEKKSKKKDDTLL